jgi:hypothetical protein
VENRALANLKAEAAAAAEAGRVFLFSGSPGLPIVRRNAHLGIIVVQTLLLNQPTLKDQYSLGRGSDCETATRSDSTIVG